jgi:hypothetical protein
MSLSITQSPASASLAQSPIIFTVAESNPLLITSTSFQYIGELYYWTGSVYNSGSSDYTITKYSNTKGVGIFDLNRIIYSTLTDLAQTNQSNVTYFVTDFYTQYLNGTTFVTGSHVKSVVYKALDGYGIFPETIGAALNTLTPYYPLLTDGPVTQSVFVDNKGVSGVYVGDIGVTVPTKVVYTSNITSADYSISGNESSSAQIVSYPIAPSQSGFPLSTVGLEWYTIQAYNGGTPLGAKIRYNVDCIQKYPNVRVKWKNRFGQFDWFNFYMVNKQSFQTTKRTYQPQLGSWEASTFAYNQYDSANLNYINDSKQSISVNTFWIPEDYNEIFKQLLVSDEIYWLYDESGNNLRPLTIATSNILFKTGVVDKQIQYSFTFNFGQPYKLIM